MLPVRISSSLRFLFAWLVVASIAPFLSPSLTLAQQGDSSDEAAQPDVAALIQEAYRGTTTAKTADDYSAILAICAKAIAANPTDSQTSYLENLSSWLLNKRGEKYSEQAGELAAAGKAEEAAALDVKALADFELSVDKDPTRWRAIHNRGISYAMAGRLPEALSDFNRVVQLQENYDKVWFNRAETNYSMGQYENAIRDYTRFLRLENDDATAYMNRGHAYFQLRRFREALADYDRAVDLDSNNAEALANRGDAYQSLGQWYEAAEDYRTALRLDANLARVYQSAAWLMATCPDERFRDTDRALRAAQRGVELAEDEDFRYLDTWAAAHANAEDFDQAVQTIDQAIAVAPAEEVETLKRRKALYQQKQAYRQGMFR